VREDCDAARAELPVSPPSRSAKGCGSHLSTDTQHPTLPRRRMPASGCVLLENGRSPVVGHFNFIPLPCSVTHGYPPLAASALLAPAAMRRPCN